jgi:type IV pilus assembly protein PilV
MKPIRAFISRSPRQQRGFGLLEVLVTVIVLSVGLLGLAGLQATSLRFNSSAYQRSQATHLAYDLADRMRANRADARSGAYDGDWLGVTPDCQTITLTGTLVEQDVQGWRNALACTLPQGTGRVATDNGVVTLVVQWDDSRGQLAPQQFAMMTDL